MEAYLLSHETLGGGFQVISIFVDLRNLRLSRRPGTSAEITALMAADVSQ
jgi:hypothetical protein